ncbi:MAG: glycoside hydrolase family 3 protein [Gammaproteobacteria bacterium]|nr:glycoside hydrolase family 3 protein [Gammaproteobacteria bacterium]
MKQRLFSFLIALLLAGSALADAGKVTWPKIKSAIPKDPAIESRIDEIMAGMSVKEKVGQLIQAEIKNISPAEVKKYHIGSVLSGGGSFPGSKSDDAIAWVAAANKFYEASVSKPKRRAAIPIIWGIDAVHGHNNVKGATIFPHNVGLGATRNPKLIKAIGEVTAREVAVTAIRWTFAPTVAVSRDDRWGRAYESYSENPKLVARYAQAMVLGLQGNPKGDDLFGPDKVVATAKHFIGDGGTNLGVDQGDTLIDEKTLRNIHGRGYFTALAAGAQTVMATFNSWNGVKAHGNKYLLTDVLKNQMGFDGFVVGDWNGHGQVPGCSDSSCAQAINAGVDMIMVPEKWRDFLKSTLRQVKSGEISKERLDDAVRRILRVKIRAGLFEMGKPSEQKFAGRAQILGHPKHRAVARQAVRESLVLLKNEGNTLPIPKGSQVFITGAGANSIPMQSGGWSVTWQGDNIYNSDFPGATSIYDGFKKHLGAESVELGKGSEYKNEPDVAIVVFGEKPYAEMKGDIKGELRYSGEAENLKLIEAFRDKDIPVVAIFLSGRPLWINSLIDATDAFVAAWLPGTEGDGIAEVLVGDEDGFPINDFKGKLSFSWPDRPDQVPLNIGDEDYDPRYAYGYGLRYKDSE